MKTTRELPPQNAHERTWFQVGTWVYVKGYRREGKRRVERVLTEVAGGRMLNVPVDGFVCWNVYDLVKAKRG